MLTKSGRTHCLSAFLFFLATAIAIPAYADETSYAVGVAAVNITPDFPVRLNGFGFRRGESEGVTQPIWAKAIAIGSDEQKPVVLITVDSLGMRLPMVEEVARRLKDKAGIERERLTVTFTHSHTAPKVNGASDTIFSSPIPPDQQAHVDRYTNDLTDWLEEVALAALADRKPSRLGWAVGTVGFAKNRRTEGGPVDHDLPMLVVKSAADDSIRAIYVSYACHCVTLSNNKISGDWAGYAQAAIQRNHPGAIALVSIGCGSDSNPSSGVTGDNIAAAAEQGAQIADEVDRLLQRPLKPISGAISTTLKNIELPLNALPDRSQLEAAAAIDDAAGYNAKYQLAKLDRNEALQSAIIYPIQTISFGDSLTMLFLAGEVCVDYSLRLKKELDADRVWLHGYSNDFGCYVPSERLLKEGGYGGGAEITYFALPTTLAPGLEEQIIAEVHRQAPKSYQAKVAAPPTDAADAIAKLVEGLAVGTPAEYERIPEIWRIAIEAAKRNDAAELQRILSQAIPGADTPATHWQVVVIGGGIINGLSMENVWPGPRIRELIDADPPLKARWERLLQLSAAMADDESVPSGTRYDALRILGADDFETSGAQLEKYLDDANAELQMGAVSGLSDMEDDAAAKALVAAFPHYNDHNRNLAIDALLRTEPRRVLLRQALESGQANRDMLTPEQVTRLQQ